jgi:hypothetical protein
MKTPMLCGNRLFSVVAQLKIFSELGLFSVRIRSSLSFVKELAQLALAPSWRQAHLISLRRRLPLKEPASSQTPKIRRALNSPSLYLLLKDFRW